MTSIIPVTSHGYIKMLVAYGSQAIGTWCEEHGIKWPDISTEEDGIVLLHFPDDVIATAFKLRWL